MRAALILLTAVALASCQPAASQPTSGSSEDTSTVTPATSPPGETVSVVRVFDGDSLVVLLDGEDVEVRLLGVNAPEGDECHGDVARKTLEELVADSDVTMVADDENSDQYGRLLRYLYVDGLNINLALIASGAAIALQGDHSLDTDFATMSDAAAASSLGMWAPDACGESPVDVVEVVDFEYNPRGRDADNANEEWVALGNDGDTAIDLTDWILRDESTLHRYRFPADFSLDSGVQVRVHSGCGDDTDRDLYWCAGDPVWSNGGDTIILQTQDGTVVTRVRYSGDY